MVGGWKYKIDDPRWPLWGNTGRKSAVDWIINRKLNLLLPQYIQEEPLWQGDRKGGKKILPRWTKGWVLRGRKSIVSAFSCVILYDLWCNLDVIFKPPFYLPYGPFLSENQIKTKTQLSPLCSIFDRSGSIEWLVARLVDGFGRDGRKQRASRE